MSVKKIGSMQFPRNPKVRSPLRALGNIAVSGQLTLPRWATLGQQSDPGVKVLPRSSYSVSRS
ncbi:MAG: hypothetical protein F6J93_16835 [Oscillatoria sp. SIO1A7]|nr:hypothetical protein [Oscillatoria sp. SIO1A7]